MNCRLQHRRVFGFFAALFTAVAVFAGAAARASTGPRYAALRNQFHCDRKLTYAQIQADPTRYIGQVLELRGTVGGKVQTGKTVSIMLNLPDNNAPALEIPASEAPVLAEYVTPNLRVLVKVGETANGNVVPLTVLAVAHDSEVQAVETAAAQHAAAVAKAVEQERQERERFHEAAMRAFHKHSPMALAARGQFTRGLAPATIVGPSVTGALSARAQPLFSPYFNFILSHNPRLGVVQAESITFHLLNFSDRYNVDPRLVVSMIIAESDFDPNSTSHSGAMGLGQLMPETARDLGVNNAYDPVQNLNGSIAYLRSRLDTFADKAAPGGEMTFEQVALAMAAYNAGENAVKKYHGVPPYRETQAYVRRVISLYRALCGN